MSNGLRKLGQTIRYSQAASITSANLATGNLAYFGVATVLAIWAAAFLAGANDTLTISYALGAAFVTLVTGLSLNVNAAGPQQLNDLVGEYAFPMGAAVTITLTSDATAGTHTGVIRALIQSS